MARRSESETRQRTVKRMVRLTALEDALLCSRAAAAGVSVASYLRRMALDPSPTPQDAGSSEREAP